MYFHAKFRCSLYYLAGRKSMFDWYLLLKIVIKFCLIFRLAKFVIIGYDTNKLINLNN